jgi:PTS system glucose-specific IIC component
MNFFRIIRSNKEKSSVNMSNNTSIKKTDSVKEFIAKLSRGLMLPIAMLPIAGLFLGIGATIVSKTQDGTI